MKYLLILFGLLTFYSSYGQQGIKGRVEWVSGNQMPGPDKILPAPVPIVREIFIYEAATLQLLKQAGPLYSSIPGKLIGKTKSKKDGSFCIKLPPGTYSVFVKETAGFFANTFDGEGCINCITVKKGKFAETAILVNYGAAY